MVEGDILLALISGGFLGYMWGEIQRKRGEVKGICIIIEFLTRKNIIGIRDDGETYLVNPDGTPGEVLWGRRKL